ncbi:MAG: alpha/beta hydrolase [Deltaproteobacteria bacterium]|nr:alpha/beta hydrolase [Deltaproteobacteria bacterium]MBW2382545.1 alpha/beta hydrolase [Deltaproteobacteria bacterium]MBW2697884.1 alpha/beta hydrolase [Deltaproteobacteria bacterium]
MKLRHGRVDIVLHERDAGRSDCLPLLLLHQVGGSSADWPERDESLGWPGPVHALDFAGHGESAHVVGGGYYPEYHLADADLALEAIGDRAAVAGAGGGAYVALLLAGARPDRVPAALLLPGRGLAGGGDAPEFSELDMPSFDEWEEQVSADARRYRPGTDRGVSRCERDLRPLDYVKPFAEASNRLLLSRDLPVAEAPGWLRMAADAECSEMAPAGLGEGIRRLAKRTA